VGCFSGDGEFEEFVVFFVTAGGDGDSGFVQYRNIYQRTLRACLESKGLMQINILISEG
jgi:hypothetical protein